MSPQDGRGDNSSLGFEKDVLVIKRGLVSWLASIRKAWWNMRDLDPVWISLCTVYLLA